MVTADRALRDQVQAAGADVTGPGTFRAALPGIRPRPDLRVYPAAGSTERRGSGLE